MSKFAGFIVGAIEIGVGLATGNVALVVTGVLTIASQAVVDLTMPKGPKSRNALETELQLGEVPRRVIFGKTATAGSLVDAFNYGGKYGTDQEVVIFALADHECEELVEFYVNDLKITYTGDGAYTQIDPTADSPHLYVYFRSGTEFQTLPSVVDTYGPGWTSADNGAGICYVVVDYRADKPDNKKLAFPGGRPSFLWVVKGKKCYDPRLDDTEGGSGSHRWDDPSTWEWSENPIVCAYNWRRGIYACDRVDQPEMLLIGRGLTTTEAPPSFIFSDANLCDEVMDDDLPRYTIGGIIAADEKYIDVEEKFAASCGGIIIQPEGTVQIEPAQARTPSFSFTDDDIIVGTTVEWNQGVLSQAAADWINTVVPQFVSPAQKWQDHAAPVRRVQADVLADGGSREETIQLQLVTVERQASDVGEIHRKLGRLWGRANVVLGPEHSDIEEGDWGTWTSARYGFTKTFRVEGYGLDITRKNALALREINSAVYDGVFGQGSATGSATSWDDANPSAPPDTGAPDDASWTLTAVSLASGSFSVPALEIAGSNSDDDSAEAITFEYWKDDGVIDPVANPDDPTWSAFGTVAPTTTKVDITSIQPGADYYAAVTYVVSGAPGDRLVLGPVTAGSLSAAVGDGDYGDVTVGSGGTDFSVNDGAITFAKMQDIATKRVIGRNSASSGDPEEVTVDQVLDWITGTAAQGDIFYRGASGIARLAAGTSGQFLKTQGAGANPAWATPSGGVGGSFRGALVKKSADQTGANFSVEAAVTWPAEEYDTDGIHDNITNNTRLTVPSAVSKVRVGFGLFLSSITSGTATYATIYKNGATYVGVARLHYTATPNSQWSGGTWTAVLNVSEGDYFELKIQSGADASVTVLAADSWFAMEIVA